MAAKLESLVVDLQLNTAALRSGLDQANQKFSGFEKQLRAMNDRLRGFGAAAALAIGKQAVEALTRFALHGAEVADQMGKMAQSAGVGVEEFSRMAYAFKLSDVSAEELGGAFNKLNKKLAEAGGGGKDAGKFFRAMGIEVKDAAGNVRASDAVMRDLAQRFSELPDGASKSALALEVFGKTGTKLLPALNAGADGIRKLEKEADRLGATISAKAAKSAEDFNDNVTRLRTAVDGVAIGVAAGLTPALSNLTDQLLNSKDGTDALKSAATGLTGVFKGLLSIGAILSGVFEVVGKYIARVASAVWNVVQGRFKEALDNVATFTTDMVGDTLSAASGVGDKLEAIWSDSAKAAENSSERTKKASKAAADQIVADLAKETEAAKKFQRELLELADSLAMDAELSGNQLDHDLGGRRASFANITASPGDVFSQATAGFSDFNAALVELAEQTRLQTDLISAAKILEKEASQEANLEVAAAARKSADELYRQAQAAGFAAQRADVAAGAFEGLAVDTKRAFDEALAQVRAGADAIGQQLFAAGMSIANHVGDLGSAVQGVIQGFQAGGIWGAIIALIVEILVRLESFGAALEQFEATWVQSLSNVNDDLQGLLGAFGELAGFVTRFADAIEQVVGAVLEPLFDMIGGWLSAIVEAIEPLIVIIEALASVLKPIFELFGAISKVLVPLAPILAIVGFVLKIVALILLAIMNAIGTVINAIAKAFGATEDVVNVTEIRQNMETIANSLGEGFGVVNNSIETGGKDIKVAFEDAAKAIRGSMPGGQLNRDEWYQRENLMWQAGKRTTLPTEEEWKKYLIDANPNRAMDANEWEAYKQANPQDRRTYQEYLESLEGYVKPLGEAMDEAAKQVEKFNAAFANLPTGYKLNLARFNADRGGAPWAASLNDKQSGIAMRDTVINVYGDGTISSEELLRRLVSGIERVNFRRTGSTVSAGNGIGSSGRTPRGA